MAAQKSCTAFCAVSHKSFAQSFWRTFALGKLCAVVVVGVGVGVGVGVACSFGVSAGLLSLILDVNGYFICLSLSLGVSVCPQPRWVGGDGFVSASVDVCVAGQTNAPTCEQEKKNHTNTQLDAQKGRGCLCNFCVCSECHLMTFVQSRAVTILPAEWADNGRRK